MRVQETRRAAAFCIRWTLSNKYCGSSANNELQLSSLDVTKAWTNVSVSLGLEMGVLAIFGLKNRISETLTINNVFVKGFYVSNSCEDNFTWKCQYLKITACDLQDLQDLHWIMENLFVIQLTFWFLFWFLILERFLTVFVSLSTNFYPLGVFCRLWVKPFRFMIKCYLQGNIFSC